VTEATPLPAAGGWVIRAATDDDAGAIGSVAAVTWRATYAGIIAAEHIERFVAGAYSEPSIRRRIATSDRFDVAVSPLSGIVGFAEWTVRDRSAELVATYVLPEWQRRGIGGAFHALSLAAYRGRIDRLFVHVARDNLPARAFYRSMGYADAEEVAFELFGVALPEIRMEQPLG
jgi:ribosomal protein S18 acetylase RimI-like enzyme